jgi:hypothetical protein
MELLNVGDKVIVNNEIEGVVVDVINHDKYIVSYPSTTGAKPMTHEFKAEWLKKVNAEESDDSGPEYCGEQFDINEILNPNEEGPVAVDFPQVNEGLTLKQEIDNEQFVKEFNDELAKAEQMNTRKEALEDEHEESLLSDRADEIAAIKEDREENKD